METMAERDESAPTMPQLNVAMSRLIKLIVFVGGMTSIGIEISASRLLAPYFGDSTFIWANVIGTTLTFLSLGYWLGGKVADRRPDPLLLFALTAIAGLSACVIPIVSKPILRLSLDAFDTVSIGEFYGSLIGVLVLFAVPITLLGFVSPFAIRLLVSDIASAGNTSGNLYALSTFGSIAGSFLPVLVLVPLLGTAKTFYVFGGTIVVLSITGLLIARKPKPSALLTLASLAVLTFVWVGGGGAIKLPYRGDLVYETESAYNYIQVLDDDGRIMLALNEGQAIHSIYDPDNLVTGGPWDYFGLGPLFADNFDPSAVQSACIVGLAGGTAARELAEVYPGIAIDGIEIDGEIARLGREYFGLDQVPNLSTHIEDGRYFLETTDSTYDIVAVDAYHQPYIPFQLTTKEFFELVQDHLTTNGVAVINVGRTDTDFRLVDVISSTMRSVFPYVFAVDVDRYNNTMLFGFSSPASVESFLQHASALPEGSLVQIVSGLALQSGNIRPGPEGDRIFTDDHAPIEFYTDLLILDAAREGEQP
jgi:predicted membrane-bound spermidine synthase